MMVPDRFYEKFDGQDPAMRHRDIDKEDVMMTRAALAMCENIDWNVGRLLNKLEALKLHENTIVVYFSDNGPNSYRWNGGMKGRKGAIDEGGLRSPCFIRWPGQIPAKSSIPQIAGAIDLLPTLAELSGVELNVDKPLDGRSLGPLLLGKTIDWKPRQLLAIKNKQVSVRSQKYRLDANGRLFDIEADPGQHTDVAESHPRLAKQLLQRAEQHARAMAIQFEANASRPFTVGYEASTTLTARDGVEHGTIQRSAKPPNNSFFTHWSSVDDSITWEIDVGQTGNYEAIVHYTCAAGDEGATVRLGMEGGDSIQANVNKVFDPPLYDKSKERVANSHYFVKDFSPLSLGKMRLEKGRGTLQLDALEIKGERVIDVHSLDLILR